MHSSPGRTSLHLTVTTETVLGVTRGTPASCAAKARHRIPEKPKAAIDDLSIFMSRLSLEFLNSHVANNTPNLRDATFVCQTMLTRVDDSIQTICPRLD